MAIAAIRHPADVTLPADPQEVLDALSRSFTAQERERLAEEFVEALASVKAEDDFRPVVDLIESWYRTALLRQDPEWPAIREELHRQTPRGPGHSVEELRRELSA